MTEAAVASDIHQTLDVHRDVAAEIAFDVTVVFNFRAELLLFFLGEAWRLITLQYSHIGLTDGLTFIKCRPP